MENKNRFNWFIVFSTIIFANMVYAAQNPNALSTDKRMKVVNYDPNNVVTIIGNHLIQTGLIFSKQESIDGIYIGDQIAWTYALNKTQPYMLFIKPTLNASNTNMTVTTNRHIYNFNLLTYQQSGANSPSVTYSIRFAYPLDEQQKIQEEIKEKQRLQKTLVSDSPVQPEHWNWDYSFSGDKTIAPIHAFDDGRFTYFEFNAHTDFPAIFIVDSQGKEMLVNSHARGKYMVVERIAQHFSLRSGMKSTCVFNDVDKI